MNDEMGEFLEKMFRAMMSFSMHINALMIDRVNSSVTALQTRLEQKGILSQDDTFAIEQLQDELISQHKRLSAAMRACKEDLDNPAVQDVMREICVLTNYPFERALYRVKRIKAEVEDEVEAQGEMVLKELEE